MLPLIGLALQAAPFIARLIGGDKTGDVVNQITTTASAIFKTDDPKEIEKKIAEDRALYVQWQTKLGELAAEKDRLEHEERLAEFNNVINARANYGASKNITDTLARTTVIAFFLLNTGVISAVFYMMLNGAPALVTKNVELSLAAWGMVNAILGWVNSKTDVVYNFFMGSSRGSSDKNEAINDAMRNLSKAVTK